MKLGYYVQGGMDEAVVQGLANRWCPDSELAEGRFRGSSGESFRREIRKSLIDLKDDKKCDFLVVLTDADTNRWRDVKRREWAKVPDDYRHLTLFGVADRNIECWLAIDRAALAHEIGCGVGEIPAGDPSGFIKRRFRLSGRNRAQDAQERVRDFVARVSLRPWIEGSDSFNDFYGDARRLAVRIGCPFPNELEN